LLAEVRGPRVGFRSDRVDEVDAEAQMKRLVAHDVLELLADAGHLSLSFESEHHRKAGVKEDSLHDDVKADQVAHERPNVLLTLDFEVVAVDHAREIDDELVFVLDSGDPVVHSIEVVRIEAQRITAVDERVRMNRLLVGLSEEILATFGGGNVVVD